MFSIKCRSIFPTELYFVNLYDEKENSSYRQELIRLSQTEKSQVRSNRNGWQSDTELWKNPIFEPLLKKSSHIVQSVISEISTHRPEFVIRALWGNVNPKGGYNFTHVHPSGWMSGVYYVALSENNSEIVFQDPRPTRMMDFQRSCLIKDEYFSHSPKIGELILFPSWLPHFVNPNLSDENRISISFNVELLV